MPYLSDAMASRWLASRRVVVVPGAMKSGTCSLRGQLQWMAYWDDLSLPSQELHFFDEDEEWARGPAYYASWFEDCSIIGDVTPSYLYIPAAIERLADQLPQAQLVVLLRNPIARAVSHQNHDHDKDRPVGSLSERYQHEMANYGSPPSRWDAFRRGLYAEQIERLLQFFPADQVLVIIAERFRKQPERELRRVRAFLGLESVRVPAEALMEEHVRYEYSEVLSAPLREEPWHGGQNNAIRCCRYIGYLFTRFSDLNYTLLILTDMN